MALEKDDIGDNANTTDDNAVEKRLSSYVIPLLLPLVVGIYFSHIETLIRNVALGTVAIYLLRSVNAHFLSLVVMTLLVMSTVIALFSPIFQAFLYGGFATLHLRAVAFAQLVSLQSITAALFMAVQSPALYGLHTSFLNALRAMLLMLVPPMTTITTSVLLMFFFSDRSFPLAVCVAEAALLSIFARPFDVKGAAHTAHLIGAGFVAIMLLTVPITTALLLYSSFWADFLTLTLSLIMLVGAGAIKIFTFLPARAIAALSPSLRPHITRALKAASTISDRRAMIIPAATMVLSHALLAMVAPPPASFILCGLLVLCAAPFLLIVEPRTEGTALPHSERSRFILVAFVAFMLIAVVVVDVIDSASSTLVLALTVLVPAVWAVTELVKVTLAPITVRVIRAIYVMIWIDVVVLPLHTLAEKSLVDTVVHRMAMLVIAGMPCLALETGPILESNKVHPVALWAIWSAVATVTVLSSDVVVSLVAAGGFVMGSPDMDALVPNIETAFALSSPTGWVLRAAIWMVISGALAAYSATHVAAAEDENDAPALPGADQPKLSRSERIARFFYSPDTRPALSQRMLLLGVALVAAGGFITVMDGPWTEADILETPPKVGSEVFLAAAVLTLPLFAMIMPMGRSLFFTIIVLLGTLFGIVAVPDVFSAFVLVVIVIQVGITVVASVDAAITALTFMTVLPLLLWVAGSGIVYESVEVSSAILTVLTTLALVAVACGLVLAITYRYMYFHLLIAITCTGMGTSSPPEDYIPKFGSTFHQFILTNTCNELSRRAGPAAVRAGAMLSRLAFAASFLAIGSYGMACLWASLSGITVHVFFVLSPMLLVITRINIATPRRRLAVLVFVLSLSLFLRCLTELTIGVAKVVDVRSAIVGGDRTMEWAELWRWGVVVWLDGLRVAMGSVGAILLALALWVGDSIARGDSAALSDVAASLGIEVSDSAASRAIGLMGVSTKRLRRQIASFVKTVGSWRLAFVFALGAVFSAFGIYATYEGAGLLNLVGLAGFVYAIYVTWELKAE
ncbi:hypothetical protein J8273_2848 [Carpediemonas membranifera]|uniref:Uncharacterized protein n=1 Tax=Carpediemonas membranifera TaxID=201153 RepID=A0A8J6B730_9EUKA|nr:hypothetical protein J8273_2848 [Carpediemonas membranifera]|eukprot:KAG9395644.1 hypothetical protein J8273_2848 [Carpediemonas membranifera]